MKIDAIKHVDGRVWIRGDGKVVYATRGMVDITAAMNALGFGVKRRRKPESAAAVWGALNAATVVKHPAYSAPLAGGAK